MLITVYAVHWVAAYLHTVFWRDVDAFRNLNFTNGATQSLKRRLGLRVRRDLFSDLADAYRSKGARHTHRDPHAHADDNGFRIKPT